MRGLSRFRDVGAGLASARNQKGAHHEGHEEYKGVSIIIQMKDLGFKGLRF
jgi:hypothetical protein